MKGQFIEVEKDGEWRCLGTCLEVLPVSGYETEYPRPVLIVYETQDRKNPEIRRFLWMHQKMRVARGPFPA